MRQTTESPLHGGNVQRWLFGRTVRLSRSISNAIMDKFGTDKQQNPWVKPAYIDALSEKANKAEAIMYYTKRHGIDLSVDLTERGIRMLKSANDISSKDFWESSLINSV